MKSGSGRSGDRPLLQVVGEVGGQPPPTGGRGGRGTEPPPTGGRGGRGTGPLLQVVGEGPGDRSLLSAYRWSGRSGDRAPSYRWSGRSGDRAPSYRGSGESTGDQGDRGTGPLARGSSESWQQFEFRRRCGRMPAGLTVWKLPARRSGRSWPSWEINIQRLRERLFEGSELRRFVNVYVNDEDIRYLDDLATPVSPGDELSIIPAVAGG